MRTDKTLLKTLYRITLILLLGSSLSAAAQGPVVDEQPLIFGLLPSESAISKFKRYAPLRDYLSTHLHRKVLLETARDFPEFLRRSKERRYDLLETAPHYVAVTLDSAKYEVLTSIDQPLAVTVVVRSDSNISNLQGLKQRVVATPSPSALVTKLGEDLLHEHGLTGANNPTFKSYKTHNAAYEAVLGRQADAAMIASNQYIKAHNNKLPLKVIAQGADLPNMSILVALDLPATLRKELQKTLLGMKTTPVGKQVLHQMSYPGYRASSAKEYEALRRYSK